MSNLPVYVEEGRADIVVARPPEIVLEEAMTAAKALQKVLAGKKKPVIMNGEQYLEFEDWLTVARFYGATVRVVSTEFLDYGGVKGFLARADVLRTDGQVVSSAEAMCMNDEEKWSTRAKYEWKGPSNNRQRVKVSEEAVPLFQLRSMAQTRACAKALRNVFAWVVVLAGYKPTPAEEMTGGEEAADPGSKGSGLQPPQAKTPASPPPDAAREEAGGPSPPSTSAPASEEHITQGQGKMLFAKFKGKGFAAGADMNATVADWYGMPGLELFKLPAGLLEDCKNRIDAIPNREPGSDG